MLLHFGITPYLVFDGDYLPSKAVTEVSRAKRRAESLKAGQSLMSMGKKAEAYKEFIKAIDITPEMARLLIEELKRNKIQYVVAPYEADAQLAYLERKGIIQGVISEDSDLLVFGIKRLLTKLDEHGDCIEINRKDFTALRSIHIAGWTDADFRRMAILSGCDYLPNIEKIGLKTAYQLVRKHKDIERIIRVLSFDGKYTVPTDYLAEFTKAELTFLHQRVYCVERHEVIMLSPFEGKEPEDFEFIGKHVEARIAQRVATGELDPNTKKEIKVVYNTENYRPSPHILRRSKSVQDVSDPKGKSISEFFKSRRIPLAELDPNSFTPSPSQRRVLERQPSTIVSTPIDAIGHRLVTAVASAPAAIGGTRSHTTNAMQGRSISKRQRLCAEDDNIFTSGEFKSRFFLPAISDPGPLQKMQNKANQSGELWSDASLEEALSQLPEDLGTPCNPKRIRIFSERETVVTTSREDEGDDSQTSSTSTLKTDTSDLSSTSEIYHSFTGTDTESQPLYPDVNVSSKRMTSSFAELAKKYTLSYDKAPTRSRTPAATPLLNRSVSATYPQKSAFFTPATSKSSSRLSLSTSIHDVSYPSLPLALDPAPELEPELEANSEPSLPLLIPESPVSKTSLSNRAIKGSEDCIIPCSDIESEIEEALAWEEEQAATIVQSQAEPDCSPSSKVKSFGVWDLARFAFTG